MKIRLIITATVIAAFAGMLPGQESTLVEGVVAQVNDDIITYGQFQERYQKIEMAMMRQLTGEQLAEARKDLRKRIFNDMINEMIINQRARERGVRFTEAMFRQQIDRAKQQIGAQTDEELERALAEQAMTLEDFRNLLRKQYYLQSLFQFEVGRDLYQSESRVQNFYEEHLEFYTLPAKIRLSQLSFPYDTSNEAAKRQEAEAALQRLQNGDDFGEVYRSLNPGSPEDSNGDIGTMEMTALREEMASEVEMLDVGENTGIIELPGSFIILKMTEMTPETVLPLEEIKNRVLGDMQQDTMAREMRKYLTRIKSQSYIKILDPSFEGLYDPEYFEG